MLANILFWVLAGVIVLMGYLQMRRQYAQRNATAQAIRVACVGDSITAGALVAEGPGTSYPAQLQELLGPRYDVRNFGVGGATLQKSGDLPYWDTPAFAESEAFQPDIVVIMLGTNDTKSFNWKGIDCFLKDYRAFLQHYRSLPTKPTVYLLTPPAQFAVGANEAINFEMSDEVAGEMAEAIRRLGAEEHAPVIDIHALTARHPECFAVDGIHADAAGTMMIAKAVVEKI